MRRFSMALFIALVACGSSASSPAPAPNVIAPSVRVSPLALSLVEGTSGETDFELAIGGKIVEATAPSSDAIEVEVEEVTPAKQATYQGKVKVRALYGATGDKRFDVTVRDENGKELKVSVPVDVRALAWSPPVAWKSEGPEAREHGAIVLDAATGRAILIGGSGYSPYGTPLGDVWSYAFETKAWTKVTPEGDVPPPAGSRRVAQKLGASTAYLFGGYGADSAVNDELYRVDVTPTAVKFKKLTYSGGAPARSLHAFGYDSKNDRYVVFGGASSKPLNDTWSLKISGDVATWTKLAAAGPSARYGFFSALDDANHRLIVWSGAQSFSVVKPAQDAWALDLREAEPTWSQIAVGDAAAPAGRRNGCTVLDPETPRMFVFGGTADAKVSEAGFFVLDLRPGKEAWTRLERPNEPPVRSSGFGYWDATAKRAVCGFGNTSAAVYADWNGIGG